MVRATGDTRPRRRRRLGTTLARWYLVGIGVLLVGISVMQMAGYAAQAASGVQIVFTQEEMASVLGPAPVEGVGGAAPDAPSSGYVGAQYVDPGALFLPALLGATMLAAAAVLHRRGPKESIIAIAGGVAGLLASAYAVIAAVGVASYYRMPVGDALPLVAVASLPVIAAAAALWGVVAERRRLGVSPMTDPPAR